MRDWYFQLMGQELGPFSAAELKAKVDSGQIQRDTQVRRGTEGKWLFAARVKGLLPEPTEIEPPIVPLRMKPKSSMSLPAVSDLPVPAPPEPASPPLPPRSSPAIIISLSDDDDEAKSPSVEFYDFVGFREAISPVLNQAVRKHLKEHSLTMTQLNRKALANLIGRPELAGDLMITNLAVIPQQVNEKSNAGGRDPLNDEDRVEHATFRATIFNCSMRALHVTQAEFLPESIEIREYDEVGTRPCSVLDHKGHISLSLDSAKASVALTAPLKITLQPLTATAVIFWFRGTTKPSLTRVRGHLRLHADDEVAYSENFSIVMHGDSPS